MTNQKLSKRSAHDTADICIQRLDTLIDRASAPFGEHSAVLATIIDLLNVMIHVFDQQNVVIKHFFVLVIVTGSTSGMT